MHKDNLEDVTPAGSASAIFIDPTPLPPADKLITPDTPDPEREELRDSALAKLVKLGLTLEEAQAVAGTNE